MVLSAWRWAWLLAVFSTIASAQEAAPAQQAAPAQEAAPAEAARPPEAESAPAYSTVVTARAAQATPYELPASVNVVDAERLAELQPRTTAEALREQPGVWVQQTGAYGGAPIIRGFIGNQVIYLFDGVRRNTVSLFTGANSYLNMTDPFSLQRVEVIRGPGSVLYGSDGIGGVLNVITAAPLSFSTRGWDVHSRVGGWYESVDDGVTLGVGQQASSETLFTDIGGSYQRFGDLRAGGGRGLQEPSRFRQFSVHGQLGLKLSERDTLELLLQDVHKPRATRFDRPNWVEHDDRQMYVLRYEGRRHGPFSNLKAELYWHDQHSFTDEKAFDSEAAMRSLGAEVQAASRFGPLRLTYGLHYHHDVSHEADPQGHTHQPRVTWDNPAAFVLGELYVGSRVRLEAGARADVYVLTATAPEDPASIPLGLSAADLDLTRTDAAPTGSLGATVTLSPQWEWVTYAGTAFRAPNKSDYLGVGVFTLGYRVPPSGTLEPERSYTAETGVRTHGDWLDGSVGVFYTQLENLIRTEPTTYNGSPTVNVGGSDLNVYATANVAHANAYGAEFSARFHPRPGWSLYAVGTWMRGWVSGGEPLDYLIPPNGVLGARWQSGETQPRFYAEAEAVGAAPYGLISSNLKERDPAYRVDPQDLTSDSILVNGKLPGFLVFNLRGGVRALSWLQLTLDLENLTNRRYRVKDSRIDNPGFTARLGATVRL